MSDKPATLSEKLDELERVIAAFRSNDEILNESNREALDYIELLVKALYPKRNSKLK